MFFETFCALKFWSLSGIWSLSNTGWSFSQASISTLYQSLLLGTTVQVTNHLYCWSLQGSTVKVSGEGHEVISQNHTLWQLWEWWCGKSSVGGQGLPRLTQQSIQNCSNYTHSHNSLKHVKHQYSRAAECENKKKDSKWGVNSQAENIFESSCVKQEWLCVCVCVRECVHARV